MKYTVNASGRVYYSFSIEAEDLDHAKDIIAQGDYEQGPILDDDGWQIDEIYESKETTV